MSARTILVCNGCGATKTLSTPGNLNETRNYFRREGWVYWRRGEDYCDKCAPAVKAEHARRQTEYA